MRWKTVKLGDVAEAIRGVTFSSGQAESEPFDNSIACLTTSGVQQEVNWPSRRFIPLDCVKQEKQILKIGDILVSTANSKELVGKSSFVSGLPYSSTFGAFVTVVRPKGNVVPYYLAKWMKTAEFLNTCYVACSNTTNISNLRVSELMAFEMPLPPLEEQQRIAGILARADRLRQLRHTALQLSEGYLQSVFLQLFGDPVTNPMGWEIRLLRNIARVSRGKFTPRPRNDPKYYGGEYPFIQTGDISRSNGYLRTWSQTLNHKGIRVSKAFDVGTVLVAIVGATIGETAILSFKSYCPDSVIGIEINSGESQPEFIEHLLRFWKPIFHARAPETARANINLDTLRPLPVISPPFEQQVQFASIVQQVERLRAQQHEAARQADHLFATLLHRAFTPSP